MSWLISIMFIVAILTSAVTLWYAVLKQSWLLHKARKQKDRHSSV